MNVEVKRCMYVPRMKDLGEVKGLAQGKLMVKIRGPYMRRGQFWVYMKHRPIVDWLALTPGPSFDAANGRALTSVGAYETGLANR